MARLIGYIILAGLLVYAAVWMAERPGDVTLQWLGWRVDTNVPVLLLSIGLAIFGFWLLWRIIKTILDVPGSVGRRRREKRLTKGMRALAEGWAAVIAEDVYRARKKAAEADDLLEEKTPSLLLLARASLLGDDRTLARELNSRLLDDKVTELAGLRGMMEESLSEGSLDDAAVYAHNAFEIDPRAAWAGRALFASLARVRDWDRAQNVLATGRRNGVFSAQEAGRLQATIFIEKADAEAQKGHTHEAARLARKARDADPGYVPASVRLISALGTEGNTRKAASEAEAAWKKGPHADIARTYMNLWRDEDSLKRVNHAERLSVANPEHLESRLVVAEAAADAGLWGQARGRLKPLIDAGESDARIAVLMARIEEGEHGDLESTVRWLRQAAQGTTLSGWRCTECLAPSKQWTSHCPNCDAFGTLVSAAGKGLVQHVPQTVPGPVGHPEEVAVAPRRVAGAA